MDNVSYVTGGTANGLYIDTTASPGVGASTTTSAPTAAGTYYGYATGSACNAGATTIPAGIKWASSFTNA